MTKKILNEITFIYKNKINIKIKNGNGWNFTQNSHFLNIIFYLIYAYLKKIDQTLLHNGYISIVHWNEDYPIIAWNDKNPYNRVIYLTAGELYWSQCVYQLAHELTHYFIGGTQDKHNNWFYEALAELASNYFLVEMGIICSELLIPEISSYAKNFSDYQQKNTKLSRVNAITSPSEWLNVHESELYQEKTNRVLNAQVAKLLFPYFQKEPDIWNILFFAPHKTCTLSELLKEWDDSINKSQYVYRQNLSRHLAYFQQLFLI